MHAPVADVETPIFVETGQADAVAGAPQGQFDRGLRKGNAPVVALPGAAIQQQCGQPGGMRRPGGRADEVAVDVRLVDRNFDTRASQNHAFHVP